MGKSLRRSRRSRNRRTRRRTQSGGRASGGYNFNSKNPVGGQAVVTAYDAYGPAPHMSQNGGRRRRRVSRGGAGDTPWWRNPLGFLKGKKTPCKTEYEKCKTTCKTKQTDCDWCD